MHNKFYNKKKIQERIENKINTLCNAFQDEGIRNQINALPKTKETLDLIEEELDSLIQGIPGNSKKEKWYNFYNSWRQAANAIKAKGVN